MFSIRMLVLLALPPVVSTASLITNGDFETTDGTAGLFYGLPLNTMPLGAWDVYAHIPGWTAVPTSNGTPGGGIEVNNNTPEEFAILQAHSGTHYVELDSDITSLSQGAQKNSAMLQQVFLATGTYQFSFWYQPRAGCCGPSDNGIHAAVVDADDHSLLDLFANTYAPQLWSQYAGVFTVSTPGVYDVFFEAYGFDSGRGGHIDDVSLAGIPEPDTMLLVLGALLILGSWLRRR